MRYTGMMAIDVGIMVALLALGWAAYELYLAFTEVLTPGLWG